MKNQIIKTIIEQEIRYEGIKGMRAFMIHLAYELQEEGYYELSLDVLRALYVTCPVGLQLPIWKTSQGLFELCDITTYVSVMCERKTLSLSCYWKPSQDTRLWAVRGLFKELWKTLNTYELSPDNIRQEEYSRGIEDLFKCLNAALVERFVVYS